MVREKIQKIRDSNRDLAVKNLELEPKLEEVKTQLVERCVQLRLLREEYDKNFMKLSECRLYRDCTSVVTVLTSYCIIITLG